jgi:hypothetical protein
MTDTSDLINALNSGNKSGAQDVFNNLMSDKINMALDDRRTQIAQSYGSKETYEDESLGDELDADVQTISDDSAE